MTPTALPTRITIDFRDAALPSRTWILGVDETAEERMELIAFDGGASTTEPSSRRLPVSPTAVVADCTCPDFCERDHANE